MQTMLAILERPMGKVLKFYISDFPCSPFNLGSNHGFKSSDVPRAEKSFIKLYSEMSS